MSDQEQKTPVPQMPQFSQQQIALAQAMLNCRGMSAEQMVRDICKQRGIDVDEFLKQFDGFAKQ